MSLLDHCCLLWCFGCMQLFVRCKRSHQFSRGSTLSSSFFSLPPAPSVSSFLPHAQLCSAPDSCCFAFPSAPGQQRYRTSLFLLFLVHSYPYAMPPTVSRSDRLQALVKVIRRSFFTRQLAFSHLFLFLSRRPVSPLSRSSPPLTAGQATTVRPSVLRNVLGKTWQVDQFNSKNDNNKSDSKSKQLIVFFSSSCKSTLLVLEPSIRLVVRPYHDAVQHGNVFAILVHVPLQGRRTLVYAGLLWSNGQLWCRRVQVLPCKSRIGITSQGCVFL